MDTALGRRLFNTNPLWFIGVAVAVQFVLLPMPAAPVTLALLALLAWGQNAAYAMQSRSGNRNSNPYHLIAAVAASFVLFLNIRILAIDLKQMPLTLFSVYLFFTILGTLHGTDVSIGIERFFNIKTGDPDKGKPKLAKLWPMVSVLAVLLVLQIALVRGHEVTLRDGGTLRIGAGALLGLVVLSIVSEGAFAVLRFARSTDSYTFHAITVLIQIAASFLKLALILKYRMDWVMFLPTTTGSVIGNLLGANFGQYVVERINAKFDIHVLKKGEILVAWPWKQLAPFSLAVAIHLFFFGTTAWQANLILLTFAFGQTASFTLKSRAGQRKHRGFIAWSSVGSNGVWYLTMHALLLEEIGLLQAAPYVVGCCVGSLIGHLVAMRVEQRLGSLMDDLPMPASAVKTATA
jgi:hypothetical protein